LPIFKVLTVLGLSFAGGLPAIHEFIDDIADGWFGFVIAVFRRRRIVAYRFLCRFRLGFLHFFDVVK
jgi:hypothetical protein